MPCDPTFDSIIKCISMNTNLYDIIQKIYLPKSSIEIGKCERHHLIFKRASENRYLEIKNSIKCLSEPDNMKRCQSPQPRMSKQLPSIRYLQGDLHIY